MPFVKDTAYREMPFSSETPNDDYHQFMSLRRLREKISKHQNHLYRCRTVGVVYSEGQNYSLQELDDKKVEIRLSLLYMKGPTAFAAMPFTAQIFGFVHWRVGTGPCMYPIHLKRISPALARSLCATMQWVIESHHAMNPDAGQLNHKAVPSTSAGETTPEAAGPSQRPVAEVAPGKRDLATSIWDE